MRRLAVDTGGTFMDIVDIDDSNGQTIAGWFIDRVIPSND
jgi:N-methylhydantoinase A/oxoprolinase/acetone carboxylase beta subunit